MKNVSFDPKEKLLNGFDIAAEAVIGTLGPKGRNVFIDDAMAPKITNDGATIAQNIVLTDKVENMGAYLIRNTSSQTNDDAGDGTTTTAVLLHALVHECLKRPENPMEIKESLQKALKKVLAELKKKVIPMSDELIEKVALISAENPIIARLITQIIKEKGRDASIMVEDSSAFEMGREITEGYEANIGFLHPAFITDQRRAEAVLTDVPVFVTEKKIGAIADIQPLFNKFHERGITSAVIVCDDIENALLGIFVGSKVKGTFNSIVIRATGDMLKDIEAVTGATRVSDTTGVSFQNIDVDTHLGRVKKVVSDSQKTTFIPTEGGNTSTWVAHLEKFAHQEPNQYIRERLERRIAQLRGGIAVLKIGAPTDFERVYLRLKADDAVKAVKAAMEEGIVEGGGMTLYRIALKMKPTTIGEAILKRALTAPLRRIIENAGKDYAEIITEMPKDMGYNAKDDCYAPLLSDGIIDPAKVERVALENAVSAACIFITTFATISDHVEERK